MSKLTDIENALLSINPADFQTLCDAYLHLTEKGNPDIHRTGTKKGKAKTKKGTPDSFFERDGRYVLIEYTTMEKKDNVKAFIKKIKTDIDKCLDEKKTGIAVSEIEEIIYCHTSSLSTKEIADLKKYCREKKASLSIKNVDTLAMDIYTRWPHIAKDFLGIAIDTGQILSPQIFIEEYAISGLATSLTNTFYFRETELNDLSSSIANYDVTIVTGRAGVGKSRLALECLNQMKETHKKKKYTIYCTSNKQESILSDLRSYLRTDENYLILVDDANRQDTNLLTLLAVLKEKRKGEIKLVLTVRDYALDHIENTCKEYKPNIVKIEKLSDAQLKEILFSDDFKVTTPMFYKKILDIADGNPRLAIMASKVAITKKAIEALYNVSDLYDMYFEDAIQDKEVFTDVILLKTLGLLSFFIALDQKSPEFEVLLAQFDLKKTDYNESIIRLERLELVEISEDLNIARISEQNLATYFFYLSFFKKKAVDFSIILDYHFDRHYRKIEDTIVPTNNTFGYKNFKALIDPYLSDRWAKIKSDKESAIKFLNLFWAYKIDDLFAFVNDEINSIAIPIDPVFVYDNEASKKIYRKKDSIIRLLSPFLNDPSQHFVTALELGFEYVKKNPIAYWQLIDLISDNVVFNHEDQYSNHSRQNDLIMLLTKRARKKGAIYVTAFYDLIPRFMVTSYRYSQRGRKENTVIMSEYKLPMTNEVKNFRKSVWDYLIKHSSGNTSKVFDFFQKYADGSYYTQKAAFQFDFTYIKQFIDRHLNENNFDHCHAVQNLIYLFHRIGIKNKETNYLKSKFTNAVFRNYKILDYNSTRFKEEDEYDNYEEYRKIKYEEIKKAFVFENISEFDRFYKEYLMFHHHPRLRNVNIQPSFEILMRENYTNNPSLALLMLKKVIKQKNTTRYYPGAVFHNMFDFKDCNKILDLYRCMVKSDFTNKFSWLQSFYTVLPDKLINIGHVNDIYSAFNEIPANSYSYTSLDFLKRYTPHDKNIFTKVLDIIVKKNEEDLLTVHLGWDSITSNMAHFKDNIELLKKAYILFDLQSYKASHTFDHSCQGLLELTIMNEDFIIEYLNFLQKNDHTIHAREFVHLNILWSHPNADELILKILNHLKDLKVYSLEDPLADLFFGNLSVENSKKAIKLLKNFIKKNKDHLSGINMVFNIVKNSFKKEFGNFLRYYLSYNDDFEIFKKITFNKGPHVLSGDIIWSDFEAERLNEVLAEIEKIKPSAYKFSKHKAYLNEQILSLRKQTEAELRDRFLERKL